MKYCHECSSEVGELDIFCPYCGISMPDVADAAETADDPLASTIVFSSPFAIPATEIETVAEVAEVPSDDFKESAEDELANEPSVAVEADHAKLPKIESSSTNLESEVMPDLLVSEIPLPALLNADEHDKAVVDLQLVDSASDSEQIIEELDSTDIELTDQIEREEDSTEFSNLVSDLPNQEIEHELAAVEVEEKSDAVVPGEPAVLDSFEQTEIAELPSVSEEISSQIEPEIDPTPEFHLDTNDGEEATVANTGDVLNNNGLRSDTTPQVGTVDTDGRKSGLKPLAEGTILNNRYDIVRKIGGGGMGAVYLATDRNLGGVKRAVKEMVQAHIEEEQQKKAIDDFKRESMILSTLDHPSIPTIYDYFFDPQESRFYLVMKYISGGDLAGRLRSTPEGRIDERTVTEWAIQVIDVLDYLHNLPTTIVYRDLKPSNIMIDGNSGRTMLIDFGIARSINQNQEKGVTAVGTMGYAPPELFSGNVEPRSDIYSLGSTMFHLLTGADPQNNPLLIFDFQKNPRPRQINPQLSDQIERILMRSVEYNADARFSSAAEMKQALSNHLENLKTGQITFGVTEVPQSVSLSNQIVFCGFCGQRIVATDMFCAFCGSKQPLAQHGVQSGVYSRSTGTAKLVLIGTSELDSPAYSIEKNENLVGRRDPMSNIFPEVDLSKYDPQTKISRRHAKIWRDGQNYLIEDLGSSNGTILLTAVSDTLRLLPNQPHPLASGDRLRVGDTTLHFLIG